MGLSNTNVYSFRVTAINAGGSVSPGTEVVSSPIANSGAPSGVSVTPGNSTILVQWSAPVALNGTLTRGYRLEMAPVGSDYPTIPIAPLIPSGTLTYRINGLTNGVAYKIRLTTIADTGPGENVETTGTPFTTSTAPLRIDFNYDPVTTNIALRWVPPVSTGGLPIIGWAITYCDLSLYSCDPTVTTNWFTITSNTLSADPTYVIAGSSYEIGRAHV